MNKPDAPYETGLKLMGAQQQLAARSLVNLIEMISTSSHRYAQQTAELTRDALSLMQQAATAPDAQSLSQLQTQWTAACLRYGETQARATMQFVEQCGLQALNIAATNASVSPSEETPAPPQ